MSGQQQWELVTKNKKERLNGAAKKLSKTEKKKFVENAPKVEELLPLSQVKTLYSGLDPDYLKKPAENKQKSKENDAKKQQKKQQQQQLKGDKLKEKESKPKTVDAAIQKISLEELKNITSSSQARFSDTPIVWMKSISGYFDAKISVEVADPIFSSKNHEYPLCLLPSAIRSHLKESFKVAGEANLKVFFENLLISMAHEMTKGSSALGTKIILQFIATQYPKITLDAIPKCLSLQTSYQNRKPVWLSVLWAMGQAGFRDLAVGLTVWQEVMLPVFELRSYSPFVLEYLVRLLGRHAAGPALSVNQYLSVLDVIYSNFTLPHQITDSLHRQARVLRKIAVNATPDAKMHLFFQPLMERLRLPSSDAYKEELLEFLFICLTTDQQCFAVWRELYSKNISQSASLLKYIDGSWENSRSKIAQPTLKSVIEFFIKYNTGLLNSKPKTDGLQDCQKICQTILSKMAVKKGSPWKWLIFFAFLASVSVIMYDMTVHGSFKSSITGQYMKDTGALHYCEIGLEQAKLYSHKGISWTQENAPHYYAVTVDVSKPYLELMRDLGYIAYNSLCRAYIAADIWLNDNAPDFTNNVKKYGSVAADYTKSGFHEVVKFSKSSFESAQDFASKNIFVGKLSPENLQKYTHEAVNVTQQYAMWTYQWMLQQVDKVK